MICVPPEFIGDMQNKYPGIAPLKIVELWTSAVRSSTTRLSARDRIAAIKQLLENYPNEITYEGDLLFDKAKLQEISDTLVLIDKHGMGVTARQYKRDVTWLLGQLKFYKDAATEELG